MPKVSVLMGNYNNAAYIAETIESILDQTYADFEYIIIDDGSTDTSWETILKYQKKDARIIARKNNKNLGISATRNLLLDMAQGEYVAWIDSDDRAHPDRLKKQLQFLEKNKDYGIVGSWMKLMDSYGKEIGIKKLPVSNKEIRAQWFLRNSLNQTSLLIRKTCINKTGYYSIYMDPAEDYDFYVRAGVYYLLYNLPETLTYYRIHNHNTSLTKYKQTIQKTLLIRKKMRGLGYKMGVLGHIAYPMTWCMQFVPTRISLYLFHIFIKIIPYKKELK